jgi:hypothetical protein
MQDMDNINKNADKKYTPYTYFIGWSTMNKWYYGVRYSKRTKCIYSSGCHPDDLWVTYFTSSKEVKNYIRTYGHPDIIKIRKTFTTAKKAMKWERTVLHRIDAKNREDFLNKSNGVVTSYDKEHWIKKARDNRRKWENLSEEEKEKIRRERSERTINAWKNMNPEKRMQIKKEIDEKRKKRRGLLTEEDLLKTKRKKQEAWDRDGKREIHSLKMKEIGKKLEAKKTEKQKQEFKLICKKAYENITDERKKEISEKRSKTLKEWHKNMPEEKKRERIEKMKKYKAEHPRRTMYKEENNKIIIKRVLKEQVEEYLKNGWILGIKRPNAKPVSMEQLRSMGLKGGGVQRDKAIKRHEEYFAIFIQNDKDFKKFKDISGYKQPWNYFKNNLLKYKTCSEEDLLS